MRAHASIHASAAASCCLAAVFIATSGRDTARQRFSLPEIQYQKIIAVYGGNEGSKARQPGSTAATIARIAALIGCPVEDLVDGSGDPRDMAGAADLLTIRIELDVGGRARLLEFARGLTRD